MARKKISQPEDNGAGTAPPRKRRAAKRTPPVGTTPLPGTQEGPQPYQPIMSYAELASEKTRWLWDRRAQYGGPPFSVATRARARRPFRQRWPLS
jgi:hypothetical protein